MGSRGTCYLKAVENQAHVFIFELIYMQEHQFCAVYMNFNFFVVFKISKHCIFCHTDLFVPTPISIFFNFLGNLG